MREVGVAIAIAVCALAAALMQRLMPAEQLLGAGLMLVAMGTGVSILAGLVYHLALLRALRDIPHVPPRWWWQPTALHPLLSVRQRRTVLPWFVCGALAFCVVVAGALAVLAATLRAA